MFIYENLMYFFSLNKQIGFFSHRYALFFYRRKIGQLIDF